MKMVKSLQLNVPYFNEGHKRNRYIPSYLFTFTSLMRKLFVRHRTLVAIL